MPAKRPENRTILCGNASLSRKNQKKRPAAACEQQQASKQKTLLKAGFEKEINQGFSGNLLFQTSKSMDSRLICWLLLPLASTSDALK